MTRWATVVAAVRAAHEHARGRMLLEVYGGDRDAVRVSFILGIDEPAAIVAEALRLAEFGVALAMAQVRAVRLRPDLREGFSELV